MRYREFPPGPELAGVVHRFWTLEGAADPARPEFERAMPDGRPELIFNLGAPFLRRVAGGTEVQPRALLVGPTTRALLVRPTGRVDLVGARLVPGRWPALLDLRGEELVDRAPALGDASPRWRADAVGALADAGSAGARVARLEGMLRRLAGREGRAERRRDRRLDGAVRLLFTGRGRLPVRRLAELTGLSQRHLARLFRLGTGIGPRTLGRVVRFQQVLRELEQGGPVRWAALAAGHGYCDQAHLCREFRRFGGVSPSGYLAAARELARHFVDRDAGAG